jgi:hypothetical protein
MCSSSATAVPPRNPRVQIIRRAYQNNVVTAFQQGGPRIGANVERDRVTLPAGGAQHGRPVTDSQHGNKGKRLSNLRRRSYRVRSLKHATIILQRRHPVMDTVPAAGPSTIVQKEQSMMLTSLQINVRGEFGKFVINVEARTGVAAARSGRLTQGV